MSSQKIIVRSLNPNHKTFWTCSYQDAGDKQYYFLTDNGYTLKKGKPGKDDLVYRMEIPKGGTKEFDFPKEMEREFSEVSRFLKRCPKSQLVGERNPFLIKPEFEVVIEADLVKTKFDNMHEKVRGIFRMFNMPYDSLRNAAYVLGNDPTGLSHKALLLRMIGDTFEGDAMLKKTVINGTEMLAINTLVNKKGEEFERMIVVHKAIKMNLIVKENEVFMCSGRAVGATAEAVIEYCRVNPDFYDNYLVKEVSNHDNIDPDLRDIEEDAKVSEVKLGAIERKASKKSSSDADTELETAVAGVEPSIPLPASPSPVSRPLAQGANKFVAPPKRN